MGVLRRHKEGCHRDLAEEDQPAGPLGAQSGRSVPRRVRTFLIHLEICQKARPEWLVFLLLTVFRVAVSTLDFPPPRDGSDLLLLVNDLYVFSARPMDGFPQGCISMSDPQRTWAGVALTDLVKVQIYDPFSQGGQAYLGSADIEVGFAGKKRTDFPYDQDELAQAVIKVGFLIVLLKSIFLIEAEL